MNEQEELANELQAEGDWLKEQLQKADAALGKAADVIEKQADWPCPFCIHGENCMQSHNRLLSAVCDYEYDSETGCHAGIKEYLRREAEDI